MKRGNPHPPPVEGGANPLCIHRDCPNWHAQVGDTCDLAIAPVSEEHPLPSLCFRPRCANRTCHKLVPPSLRTIAPAQTGSGGSPPGTPPAQRGPSFASAREEYFTETLDWSDALDPGNFGTLDQFVCLFLLARVSTEVGMTILDPGRFGEDGPSTVSEGTDEHARITRERLRAARQATVESFWPDYVGPGLVTDPPCREDLRWRSVPDDVALRHAIWLGAAAASWKETKDVPPPRDPFAAGSSVATWHSGGPATPFKDGGVFSFKIYIWCRWVALIGDVEEAVPFKHAAGEEPPQYEAALARYIKDLMNEYGGIFGLTGSRRAEFMSSYDPKEFIINVLHPQLRALSAPARIGRPPSATRPPSPPASAPGGGDPGPQVEPGRARPPGHPSDLREAIREHERLRKRAQRQKHREERKRQEEEATSTGTPKPRSSKSESVASGTAKAKASTPASRRTARAGAPDPAPSPKPGAASPPSALSASLSLEISLETSSGTPSRAPSERPDRGHAEPSSAAPSNPELRDVPSSASPSALE